MVAGSGRDHGLATEKLTNGATHGASEEGGRAEVRGSSFEDTAPAKHRVLRAVDAEITERVRRAAQGPSDCEGPVRVGDPVFGAVHEEHAASA